MNERTEDWERRTGWIDSYVARIRPYVRVRAADSLLIRLPNQAYKLNGQAVKVLGSLLGGSSVGEILAAHADKEKVSKDLYHFFMDLSALLADRYSEKEERLAVEKVPFSLPYNTLPVLSEIAVTYRCNLSCRFCYAGCGCKKRDESADLPAAKLKEALEIIAGEAQVPSVSFTGGEPLLRSDLPELAAHAKGLGLWTNLITNGTLLSPATVSALKTAGLDSAQVSIEGGTPAEHDAIVRKAGAFEAAVTGIKALKAAGIRVHTNTTISALNKDSLESIVALVKDLGLGKFSMNMLMPVGNAGEEFNATFISYSEIGPVVERVKKMAGRSGLEFMWYSPTPMCVFNPIAKGLGNKSCAACDGLLSLAPNGDVLPCSSYPRPLGNIFEHKGGFRRLWDSEPFRFFRNKSFAHAACRSCADLAVCSGACPLYWEKAGYGELPSAGGLKAEGGTRTMEAVRS